MIRITAVLAALALPTLACAQTVSFNPPKAPQVGDVMTEVETQDLDMDMAVNTPDGQSMKMKTTEVGKESVRYEILAVAEDGAVTSMKITVNESTKTSAQNQQEQTRESPLAGKTFVVTQGEGDAVRITDESGGELEPELAQQAEQGYGNKLGKRDDKFAEVFDKDSYAIGDTITIDGEKAKEIFSDDPDSEDEMQEVSFVLTLKATEKVDGQPVAVFDAVLTMTGEPEAGMKLSAEMKGTLKILTANSALHSMQLNGPMSLEANKDGLTMDGKGTMTMETGRSYGG